MTPTDIRLHQKSKRLEVAFADGSIYWLGCAYLRLNSPSAEVQGHGTGPINIKTDLTGAADVNIKALTPVGNYAVKIIFDDGHQSGLFTWEYLYRLAQSRPEGDRPS